MRVVRSLADVGPASPSVVTIGNFDGVHRGHRAILDAVCEHAARIEARSVAVTLDPHPLRSIAPERAPVAISTLGQKARLIGRSPLDILLVQTFDEAFRRLTPRAFIRSFLIEGLGARCVCVGQNFRFGHKHAGNLDTLRASPDGLDVVDVAGVLHHDVPISSSLVRILLADGKVDTAAEMLGRPYEIEGRIVSGTGRGRRVTVPTLNLDSSNPLIPLHGVYFTRVSLEGAPFRDAVTNVGVRPTFRDDETVAEPSIETHVLDGAPAAGARQARLRFLERLRDEIDFGDPDRLRRQIEQDIDAAARYFRRRRAG